MIDNLNEINRLVLAVSDLAPNNRAALKSAVVDKCRSVAHEARFPDHFESINFCITSGLLEERANRLKLTKLGENFLSLNRDSRYTLSEEQKTLFVTECLLSGKWTRETVEILRQFVPAYRNRTYLWSATDNPPLSGNFTLVEIMCQAALLRRNAIGLVVNEKYAMVVAQVLQPAGFMSLKELAAKLKNADEVGQIAEQIAYEFEKKRLKNVGCQIEADCVTRISDLDVTAGYDMISFDGQSPNMVYDRFIEVKGSTGNDIDFFWSKNEIEQARKLGARYWLYFVGGIDNQTQMTSRQVVTIQDPLQKMLKSDKFETECAQFHVHEK